MELGNGEMPLTYPQYAIIKVWNFEFMSGLKISYHKHMVSGVGINEVSTGDFAAVLRCKVKPSLIIWDCH